MSGPADEPRQSAASEPGTEMAGAGGATLAWLWAWAPVRAAFLALGALVALTYVVVGVAAGRLAPAERLVTESLLSPPEALGTLVLVIVVFAGPLAAALASALAAAPLRAADGRPGAAGTGSIRGFLRPFLNLVGLLLVGLVLASTWGLASLLLGALLAGYPVSPVDLTAVAAVPVPLTVGCWAVVVAAALGYAAGGLTGRRLAGVAVIGGILAAELGVSLADPGSPLLAIAPISRVGGLAAEGTAGQAVPALAVASAAAIGFLGIATAARGRVARGSTVLARPGVTRDRGDGAG